MGQAICALVAAILLGSMLQEKDHGVTPLKRAPLDYFQTHCSHCHGEGGFGYPSGFAKGMTDDALGKVIARMAANQGKAALDAKDLLVQIAYHRAISDQAPFLAWTQQIGHDLKGEVSEDATLKAWVKGKPVEINAKDGIWTINLPSGAKSSDVKIVATADKRTAILVLAKASISQSKQNP